MEKVSIRPIDKSITMNDSIDFVVIKYSDTLYKIAIVMLCNRPDAEDAVQDTFIKYVKMHPSFENEEHRKAWLIRVLSNRCKDIIRYRSKRSFLDLESISEYFEEESDTEIFMCLSTLPEKYKKVLYLYYVEGYSVSDIANIIGKTNSAVKMRLKKGREILRENLNS